MTLEYTITKQGLIEIGIVVAIAHIISALTGIYALILIAIFAILKSAYEQIQITRGKQYE